MTLELLDREGWGANAKKVYRLYREEGLPMRAKRPRRHKAALMRRTKPTATARDERWSMDFMSDQLGDGRRIRVLTIVDHYTRESIPMEVGQSMGSAEVIAVLIAIGVDADGYREVLGVTEGTKEDAGSWRSFLRHLKERGLSGVRLFITDKCLGLVETLAEFYPEAAWQRCVVHFYRNVMTVVPSGKVKEVVAMLKAIHAQEDRQPAEQKAALVVEKLELMRLSRAAAIVREGVCETLRYMSFPREHRRCIKTNNLSWGRWNG